MSTMLFEIGSYRIRARSIWKPRLKIFEDHVVYRKRFWWTVTEITVTYPHIAQADIKSGIFFSTVTLINSGGADNIEIKYVLNGPAKKAKKLLDQKIHQATLRDHIDGEFKNHPIMKMDKFEKSLSRLQELLNKGHISSREYEARRKKMLKEM